MTTPHQQSKKVLEEFDKEFKEEKATEYPGGARVILFVDRAGTELTRENVKSFITSSHISLLQSVVEMVREEKLVNNYGIDFRTGHNSALEEIIKKLEEEIKQI